MTSRRRLAASPRTTADVLTMLACDREPAVRAAFARNGQAPPSLLERIACDDDWMVRFALSLRRRLSPTMLTTLSHDSAPQVRAGVAARPHLPRRMLARLLADPNLRVRETAACAHHLPARYLAWCARSPEPARRQLAAFNATLEPALRGLLARDPCWEVRRYLVFTDADRVPLSMAMELALAPELATDALVATVLVAHVKWHASQRPASAMPRKAIACFMRSTHPPLRELGRQLALAAYRARAGAIAAPATTIAA